MAVNPCGRILASLPLYSSEMLVVPRSYCYITFAGGISVPQFASSVRCQALLIRYLRGPPETAISMAYPQPCQNSYSRGFIWRTLFPPKPARFPLSLY